MKTAIRNIFQVLPGEGEEFFPLLSGSQFQLESIVSRGQSSPPGFWYDQERDEWVALMSGTAELEFEDGTALQLSAGDSLIIEAHCKHRVSSASPGAVWLALHYCP
jgi:cupin 2 domain-containing protein